MPRRPAPPKLTATARLVLDCIIQYKTESGGDSPSIRELMIATGILSPSNVKYQLDKLEKLELIQRKPNKIRSIMVIGGEWKMNGKEHPTL